MIYRTGTRQALGSIFVLFLLKYILFMIRGNLRFSAKYLPIIFAIIIFIIMAPMFVPQELIDRNYTFSVDNSILGRMYRYEYAFKLLRTNFADYIFTGFHLDNYKFYYGGLWIGTSLHNVYLVYLERVGLFSAILTFFIHMTIIYYMLSLYFNIETKNRNYVFYFVFIISVWFTIYFMSLIENFLFYVSSLEVYAFYIISCVLTNMYRERTRCQGIINH